MIISELLELVQPLRKQYDVRRIDNIAEQAGHTVIWLPPYHCELNIIESVSRKWKKIKKKKKKGKIIKNKNMPSCHTIDTR